MKPQFEVKHHFDAVDGFCLAVIVGAIFFGLRQLPDFFWLLRKAWKEFVETSRKLRQQANDRYEGKGPAKEGQGDLWANFVKWLLTGIMILAGVMAVLEFFVIAVRALIR